MIAKLQSPLAASVFGLVLSLGAGIFLSYRAVGPLLEQAAAVPAEDPEPEIRQQGWDFWTIEIDNLSNELKEERARLRKQDELLTQRAARVAAGEKELARIRTEIDRIRQDIADKVLEISTHEAKNLRTLAQSYTNLTPRAVVAIFREMDDSTAVKILSLMKAETVGPIFEEMAKTAGPEGPLARRAAILSEKLRLMKTTKPAGPA